MAKTKTPIWQRFIPGFFRDKSDHPTTPQEVKKQVATGALPAGGRPSVDATAQKYSSALLIGGKRVLKPSFDLEVIPIIRSLSKINPDISQAISDTVSLVNTGIQDIKFDKSVTPEKALEMKKYLVDQSKLWGAGTAGMHGLMNKMVSQLFIGGAISNEWVPNREKTAIVNLVFLNPENVAWVRKSGRYAPYQRMYHNFLNTFKVSKKFNAMEYTLKKLNPSTYKYLALNGDEDTPYGIPPYMAALDAIKTQGDMMENIKFTMNMIGLMGYLDAKMEKPDQQDNESEADYRARLEGILEQLKARVQEGMKDGVNAGFKDDHEFDFKSTTKSTGNMEQIWQLNELQIASGIKFDSAFLGRSYNSSETSITILFTKMLSILANAQNILKENIHYGFQLSLLMAGYSFKDMRIEMNRSTISDSLKNQQGEEIKIRNNRVLYADGIISQEQYANNVGVPSADQDEPRVPIDGDKVTDDKIAKENRKDDKGKSQKKTTDKKNPQGTIRRQNGAELTFEELLNQ